MTPSTLPAAGETLARALWHDEDGRLRARAAEAEWIAGMAAGALEATLGQLAQAGVDIALPAGAAASAWPEDAAINALAARHAAGSAEGAVAMARLRAIVARDPAQAPTLARVLRVGAPLAEDGGGAGERGPRDWGPGAALAVLTPAFAATAAGRTARLMAVECCLDRADPAEARAHLRALRADGGGALPFRAVELAFDIALAEGGIEALLAEETTLGADIERTPGALRRLIRHLRALGAVSEASALRARIPEPGKAGAADLRLLDAQEALGADEHDRALGLIAPDCPGATPWRWGAGVHAMWLRIAQPQDGAGEGAGDGLEAFVAHARAALRHLGGHPGVFRQATICRLIRDDWAAIEAELAAHHPGVPTAPVAAELLARVGRPDRALHMLRALHDCCHPDALTARARLAASAAAVAAQAGEIIAGQAMLDTVAGRAGLPAPLRIELGLRASDLALLGARLARAERILAPLVALGPNHPGLRARRARCAIIAGEADAAEAALAPLIDAREDGRTRRRMIEALRGGAAGQADDGPQIARIGRRLWRMQRRLEPPARKGEGVPMRVNLYWEGPVPAALDRALGAWRSVMPTADVVLHDLAAATDRVGRLLGRQTARAFERARHPAVRADLFRLCLIGEEGGIWTDADDLPRAPVDDWLEGVEAVVVIEQWWGTIANNFFAARPGFAPIIAARDRVARALRADPDPYAWWQTGPVPLTRAFAPLIGGGKRASRGTIRILGYAEYLGRIAPTLPLPHKASGGHWR